MNDEIGFLNGHLQKQTLIQTPQTMKTCLSAVMATVILLAISPNPSHAISPRLAFQEYYACSRDCNVYENRHSLNWVMCQADCYVNLLLDLAFSVAR
jgi:hypothetical protein